LQQNCIRAFPFSPRQCFGPRPGHFGPHLSTPWHSPFSFKGRSACSASVPAVVISSLSSCSSNPWVRSSRWPQLYRENHGPPPADTKPYLLASSQTRWPESSPKATYQSCPFQSAFLFDRFTRLVTAHCVSSLSSQVRAMYSRSPSA
jgi:hypothetical protein